MSDIISRQAAIDLLDAYAMKIADEEEYAYSWARMRLSELPSAQPELSPCDVCRYYPPTSMDENPCTMCPAEMRGE